MCGGHIFSVFRRKQLQFERHRTESPSPSARSRAARPTNAQRRRHRRNAGTATAVHRHDDGRRRQRRRLWRQHRRRAGRRAYVRRPGERVACGRGWRNVAARQEEAPPEPYHVHHLSAARTGTGVRKIPLPGRVQSRRIGHEGQFAGSQGPGEQIFIFIILLYFSRRCNI